MAWLYILECSNGTFYVGSTVNLERRIWEHENGQGANYTREHLPVKLVFAEEFARIDDAFGLETKLHGWTHAKKLALIEGRFRDLSSLGKKKWV